MSISRSDNCVSAPRRGDRVAGSAVRRSKLWRYIGNGGPAAKTINESGGITGGEAGIRTLDRGLSPYNGLANRRLRPLGHLTALPEVYAIQTLTGKFSTSTHEGRLPFKPSPLLVSSSTRAGCVARVRTAAGTVDGHSSGHSCCAFRSSRAEDGTKTTRGDGFVDRRLFSTRPPPTQVA